MPRTGTCTDPYQSYEIGSVIEHIAPISSRSDKTQEPTKGTVRDPEIALPYIGKEENIHFAVLRRIRKQKERTTSRKKGQIAIKVVIIVILFGLFVMYENLNPMLQRLLETPLFSLILKFENS